MSTLTNKQRAKIYREIADEFERKQNWKPVCAALTDKLNDSVLLPDVLKLFPEFGLFKPEINEFLTLWWAKNNDNTYNMNTRITALLFSEQIALNP